MRIKSFLGENIMKKILTTIMAASMVFATGALANTKLGYVDMQKAIKTTSAGKSAKDKLEKEIKKRTKEIEKMKGDIQKMTQDLDKKKLILSPDVKAKKQQEIQEQMLQYRELVGKTQLELQEKERKLTMPILEKLRKVISEVADKEGYTMILEKSEQSVLWAKKESDITDKVIKAFEKK